MKQTAAKNYVYTYTKNVAEKPWSQDQEYPVFAKLNWFNPLNGVSEYGYVYCYQFISVDGTRSAFDSSAYTDDDKWFDHIMPQGKQIRTVETMLCKGTGRLYGFKWVGDDGAVLVAVGDINEPDRRNNSHPQPKTSWGKTASGFEEYTEHYSF